MTDFKAGFVVSVAVIGVMAIASEVVRFNALKQHVNSSLEILKGKKEIFKRNKA